MEVGNEFILVGAALVTISIFAGLVSSRIGAPLLLVFLALGMLAGEDGPGGILFDDFELAYVVGSIALAIILFDGGLRTSRARLMLALGPALLLATVGVIVTAALTGAAAAWVLDLGPLEALLVGSIVGSTDAAAVFFLLHLHGMRLKHRVGATLEVESGVNDPMAIFLTLLCVELLTAGAVDLSWESLRPFSIEFLRQFGGGAIFGVLGGYGLLWLINRLQLASGLYPILALALALLIFAGAQTLDASGFLAIYLTGFILGDHRHRATQLIDRFHDGLAWLSQIVMFLMLGLLVTPTALVPTLVPSLAIALFLIVVARPLAVALCLLPFRFTWQEHAFVSWVGLRGAVPIFLGTMPVLAGVEGAMSFFGVAYVVVLTSLIVQGWTVAVAARRLGLELPPRPPPPQRVDIDLPLETGRDMATYTVRPRSMVMRRPIERLPMPPDTHIVSVIRDGVMREVGNLDRLAPGDYVVMIAPSEQLPTLDRYFASRSPRHRAESDEASLGEFAFDADRSIGPVAAFYGFHVPDQDLKLNLGDFLRQRLRRHPAVGRRTRVADVELIVREMKGDEISRVGIELAPEETRLSHLNRARQWCEARLHAFAGRSRAFRFWVRARYRALRQRLKQSTRTAD